MVCVANSQYVCMCVKRKPLTVKYNEMAYSFMTNGDNENNVWACVSDRITWKKILTATLLLLPISLSTGWWRAEAQEYNNSMSSRIMYGVVGKWKMAIIWEENMRTRMAHHLARIRTNEKLMRKQPNKNNGSDKYGKREACNNSNSFERRRIYILIIKNIWKWENSINSAMKKQRWTMICVW